jgi:hypothetical protein
MLEFEFFRVIADIVFDSRLLARAVRKREKSLVSPGGE